MTCFDCSKRGLIENLDRISQLPEPIIVDIISRLPLQDAARSSLLSKTWKNYCALYPILYFDHHLVLKSLMPVENLDHIRDVFMDNVDYHLSRATRLNFPVRKIALTMCTDASVFSRVDKWLELLGQVNVEELSMYLGSMNPENDGKDMNYSVRYMFPILMFALRGLRSLHVRHCGLSHRSFVGGPVIKGEVSFGLKELCLSNMLLDNYEENWFNDFIRCFQGLETLVIRNCRNVEYLKLADFPKLKNAIVEILYGDTKYIDITDTNLECFKCNVFTELRISRAACAHIRDLTLGHCDVNQPNLFRDLTATFPHLEEAEIYVGGIDALKAANNVLRKLKFNSNRNIRFKDLHIACPNLTHLDLESFGLTDLYVDCPKLKKFRFVGDTFPELFFLRSAVDLEETECIIIRKVATDTLWLINLREFLVHIMGSTTRLILTFCLPIMLVTFKPEELEAIHSSPMYNVHLTVTVIPNILQKVDSLLDGVLWIICPTTLSIAGRCYYGVKYLCENLSKKSKDSSFGAQVTSPCWLRQLEDFQVECPLDIPDIKENLAALPDQCRRVTDQIRFKFHWSQNKKQVEDVLV